MSGTNLQLFFFHFLYPYAFWSGLTYCIQYYFICAFTGVSQRFSWLAIYVALGFIMDFRPAIFRGELFNSIIGLLVIYLFVRYLLKQDSLLSAVTAVLLLLANALIEGIMLPVIYFCYNLDIAHQPYILIPLIINMATFLFLYLIKRKFQITNIGLPTMGTLFPALLPLFMLIFFIRSEIPANYMGILESGVANPSVFSMEKFLFLALFCPLCAYGYILSFFKLIQHFQSERNNLQLEYQLEVQKEQMIHTQEQDTLSRQFRHDMKNHTLVLQELIENNQNVKALKYLKELYESSQQSSCSIHSGNIAVDALLSHKLAYAKQEGITVQEDVLLQNVAAILDVDLCTIFSNALDNAIRGALQAEECSLTIKAMCNQSFLNISVTNSYNPIAKNVGGSGIGLQSIDRVCKKYNGTCQLEFQNNMAQLSILLILPT